MAHTQYLKAVKITEKVYWVGAVDWNVRDFHGYKTERGSTYNAYLIMDEKITLIDSVKAPFKNHLMSRIKSLIDPTKIDYIVSNHAEPDHSGCLAEVVAEIKPEKLFASVAGKKALEAHYTFDMEITAVKTGDEISIGKDAIKFIETKMLHWPDSMFSYLVNDKLLFSQDAFGMHLAGSQLFADEYSADILFHESEKYYANILLLYSGKIKQLLEQLPSFNLDIDIICPDHGPVWRRPEDIEKVLSWYSSWCEQTFSNKAIVIYDTMWHSTEAMALAIGDGLRDSGCVTEIINVTARDRSYVATQMLEAGAIVVGSPTLNNNIFPSMADVLTYLRGLRPEKRIGAAFGSLGWSGEAVKQLEEYLQSMKVEIVAEAIRQKYVPTEDDLKKCYDMGMTVGSELLKRLNK
ncbi:MAG: flavodoxin domain-containing protein [Victivallales bacterium]|nr:flavodoxin domain-containing protein [Victivallales bacterium]